MFLNRKSTHAIKATLPEIQKKQDQLSCKSNPSERYEKNKRNKIKQKKIRYLVTQILILTNFLHKY